MGGDKPLPYNNTVGAGFIPARETTDWRCFDILSRQNPEEHERQGIPGLLDEEQDLEFVRNLVGSRQCHRIDNAAANLSDSGA